MKKTPSGLSGSGTVNSSKLDNALSILLQLKQSMDVVNKTEVDPPVNTDRIRELNDEIKNVKTNIEQKPRTSTELFNTDSIQKNINKAKSIADTLFDKISDEGKKLTQNQTRNFVNAFKLLEGYEDKLGVDLTSKYKKIFSDMVSAVNRGEFEIPFVTGALDPDEFKQFIADAEAELSNPLSHFQYSLKDAETQATKLAIQSETQALKEQKKQIEDTNEAYIKAEREKKQTALDTASAIVESLQSELSSMINNIDSDDYLDIDNSQIIQLQELTTQILQMMESLGLQTKPIEELFEKISSKIFVPKDIIDEKALSKLEEARQTIDALKLKISELENEITNLRASEQAQESAYGDIFGEYVSEVNSLRGKIKDLQTEINDLQTDLRYSVNYFDWLRKCEEVDRLTKSVENLQNRIQELTDMNEILLDENADLQSMRSEKPVSGSGSLSEELTETKNEINGISEEASDMGDSINNSIKNINLESLIDVLNIISEKLQGIKDILGNVDEVNSFNSITQSIDILLGKLDELYSKVGESTYNVVVNEGVDKDAQKSRESIKEYTRKTASRYQSAYDKLVQRAGSEELLFSYINNVVNPPGGVTELTNLYSSISVNKLQSNEDKVYRLISFFKLLRQAAQDDTFGLDISSMSLPKGSDSTFRSRIRELSGIKQNKSPDSVLDLPNDDEVLSNILEKLKEISELLTDISKKDFLQEQFNVLSTQLQDIVNKFDQIVADVKVINDTPILTQDSELKESVIQTKEQIESATEAQKEFNESIKEQQDIITSSNEQLNLSQNEELISATEVSNGRLQEEKNALEQVGEAAKIAGEQKDLFAKSNEDVAKTASSSIDNITKEEQSFDNMGDAAEVAEEKISNADEALKRYIRNQNGDASSGNYGYTEAINQVVDKHVRIKTDKETGQEIQTEHLMINYDKLSKQLLKTDTDIFKLEQQINNAISEDTTLMELNLHILERKREIYEDLLRMMVTNPEYEVDSSQESILQNERNKNLIYLQNASAANETEIDAINRQNEEYKKLNNYVSRYAEICKRIASDNMFDGDIAEANALRAIITQMTNDLRNSSLYSFSKERNALGLLDTLPDKLRDIESKLEKNKDILESSFDKSVTKLHSNIFNLVKDLNSVELLPGFEDEIDVITNRLSLLRDGDFDSLKVIQNDFEEISIRAKDSIKDFKNIGKLEVSETAFTKNLTIITNKLKDFKKELQDNGRIDYFADEIQTLEDRLNSATTMTDLSSISNSIATLKNTKITGLDELIELTNHLYDINQQIATLEYEDADVYSNKISQLKTEANALENQINNLKQTNILQNSTNQEIYNLATEEKLLALEKTKADIAKKKNADDEKSSKETLANLQKQEDLIKQISTWIQKNSNAYKIYKNQIDDILNDLTTGATKSATELNEVKYAFTHIVTEATRAGKTGKTFADMVMSRWKALGAYLATFVQFYDIVRYIRQAAENVQELDKQMIELAKVSEQNLRQIKNDFSAYSDVAKDLGSTITDTISATADWARMGYNVPDSKELARVALLYKNVGDGIDISAANESLISTLQGYQMTADEAEHIVDVFNEVANNYAIDTAGIGEALQRSAASLNAANTSLEASVALVTAANTVVQNPESVGTTFKTLSARIRGATTELSDLGEEEDEFTQTTSKLQNLVKSLTGFDILESDQKTFKSIYDILVGIGKEWGNLTDIERASLGEALAGKTFARICSNTY